MSDAPLAYFLTWTTYGSWLPGDERGWVRRDKPGIRPPDAARAEQSRAMLVNDPLKLSIEERKVVEETIAKHGELRGWKLHAVNARSNHVHVVVTAPIDPDEVTEQFKTWCTRRIKPLRDPPPRKWWTRGQSTKYVNDEAGLVNVVEYVLYGQDQPGTVAAHHEKEPSLARRAGYPSRDREVMASSPAEVWLYTDGGCSGNPGPGGWAFILMHPSSGKKLEQSGGEALTTNNRMELQAVVEGLKALTRPTRVTLYTDSVYVGKGLSEWMPKWKAAGWRRRENNSWKEVKNVDLWQQLDELVAEHKLEYVRVAGHSGHPENDRCDELAVAAYQQFLRR